MTRAWLLAPLVFASSACLFTDLDNIPCQSDDECPTDAFCNMAEHVCNVSGADAPHVIVAGITDPGDVTGLDPFVPPDVTSTVTLHVKNDGGSAAGAVTIEFSPLACLQVEMGPLPSRIAADDTVDVALDVTPHECGVPLIVDWFSFYDGRSSRGTFNLVTRDRATPDGG